MSSLGARLADAFPAAAISTIDVDGIELPALAPCGDTEWVSAARFAESLDLRVLPRGYGSKLSWLRPPDKPDLILCTKRDVGVVAYEPGDGTLTARAGTSMEALREAVHVGGHRLTPDVARAGAKSLGGVIAAGESGFDRTGRGPTRDYVLGTRILLADGRIAKSGGALVKNVTGYDLHRLHTGSFGSLGIILEASLRLSPTPEKRLSLRARHGSRAEALHMARGMYELDLSAEALTVRTEGEEWEVELFLAGRTEVVADDASRVTGKLEAAEDRYVAARERASLDPCLLLSSSRTSFEAATETITAHLQELDVLSGELLHPSFASAEFYLGSTDGIRSTEALQALLPPGARLRFRNLPKMERARLCQPHGGNGQVLSRALRAKLDPRGRFAPILFP